jgi:hypothetical protein
MKMEGALIGGRAELPLELVETLSFRLTTTRSRVS